MRTVLVLSVVATLGLVCPTHARAVPVRQDDFVKVCLPGTIGKVSATADGIAVVFETSVPTAVAELRERTTQLASMLNRAANHPAGAQRLMVPFTATYRESTNGASLLLTPRKAADLKKLRSTIRGAIENMDLTSQCYQLANAN